MTSPVLRLMRDKRTMGFKIEGTPYTKETLVAADYGHAAYKIEYTKDIESYARKIARGDMSWDTAISGRQKISVKFSVDVYSGGTVTTPPRYFEMLRCCKMRQSAHGATGISIATHGDENRVPATIEIVEPQEGTTPKQLVIAASGCMGNANLVLDNVGLPMRIDFEFQGVLDSISTRAYASIITPSSFDTNIPTAVLSVTVSLFATTQYLGGFNVNLNNTVEVYSDPAKSQGFEGARVVASHPTMAIDPDMLVTDDVNWLTRQTGNTTGAVSVGIGSNLVMSAPAAQVVESNPGEREGHSTDALNLELQRSSGNDELELLQGSKT